MVMSTDIIIFGGFVYNSLFNNGIKVNSVSFAKQIKENTNTIRNLTGEHKKIEKDCWERVRAQLKRIGLKSKG